MYLIIYRPHNKLHCETKFIGPYATHEEAYDELCEMPALGPYADDGILNSPGVKYIQELRPALNCPYTEHSAQERLVSMLNAVGHAMIKGDER